MTAESGLKPWVTSPASARGLMQLMPKVGGALHQKHFQAPYDAIDLYQGGYNAFLGTTELMRLYDIYTPSPLQDEQIPLPLVIAGYNAGSDAVDRWMSDFQDPPTADTFGAFRRLYRNAKICSTCFGIYDEIQLDLRKLDLYKGNPYIR